jgi:hypothetical protein
MAVQQRQLLLTHQMILLAINLFCKPFQKRPDCSQNLVHHLGFGHWEFEIILPGLAVSMNEGKAG